MAGLIDSFKAAMFASPERDDPFAQDEESLLAEMDRLEKEQKDVLRHFHKSWFYQIAMRIGSQWIQAHPDGYAIMPDNDDGHVRMVVNRMLAIHQTKLGKLLKNEPWFEIRADNSSYRSRKKARKGNMVADYVYAEQKAKLKIKTLGTWCIDTGTAFLYAYWDTTLGDKVVKHKVHAGQVIGGQAVDEANNPLGFAVDGEGFVLDEQGQKVVESESRAGDVRIEVVPPFDIVPYGIKHDGSYRGIIYISAHPTAALKAQYPEFADDINSEEEKSERLKYYRQIQGIVSNEWYQATEKQKEEKVTFVRQLFEEPSPAAPDGRYVKRIGKKIIEQGPLPYKHKRIPLIRFIDIENSGQPFGMGTMQNLCAPQKGYNRSLSQLIENANTHANVKWKATRNAELEQEAIDDSTDEVIVYNQGATVEQMTPAGMPNYFMDLVGRMYPQLFQDISGQHDVTMGQAPGEVRSGYAIEQLVGQDDVRNTGTHIHFSAALQELGEQVMALYEEHLGAQNRTFHIRGTGRGVEVSPDDLTDLWKNVSVDAGTQLNGGMYQSREQILELWKNGLFGDPQDPKVRKKVMEMYEFGNIDSLFENVDQDTDWSEEENDIFMSGDTTKFVDYTPQDPMKEQLDEQGNPMPVKTLEVQEWEEHDVHIQNHDSLRKTREYRELPLPQKRAIDTHVDWHFDKKIAAQPAPPPAPGGVETPPPPAGPVV
jgi:hypothetical protein